MAWTGFSLDLAVGEARVGDVTLAGIADASDTVPGALRLADDTVLRPLTFGARALLCAGSDAASIASRVLAAAGGRPGGPAPELEVLALHLAGARVDETGPSFADAAFVVCRVFGWDPARLDEAPAHLVDGLAVSALGIDGDGTGDGDGDGDGDGTAWRTLVLAADGTEADTETTAAAVRDRLALDLLRRFRTPLSDRLSAGVSTTGAEPDVLVGAPGGAAARWHADSTDAGSSTATAASGAPQRAMGPFATGAAHQSERRREQAADGRSAGRAATGWSTPTSSSPEVVRETVAALGAGAAVGWPTLWQRPGWGESDRWASAPLPVVDDHRSGIAQGLREPADGAVTPGDRLAVLRVGDAPAGPSEPLSRHRTDGVVTATTTDPRGAATGALAARALADQLAAALDDEADLRGLVRW